MGTFSGFSEDDIRKLQSPESSSKHLENNNKEDMVHRKNLPIIKKTTLKNGPKISSDVRNKKILLSKETNNENIPQTAKLNKVQDENKTPSETTDNKPNCTIDVVIDKKPIDLKEFTVRQKQIEEQNNRRKELLSKALAAKTKQTQEEAKKLQEIQMEFKKLDADLSNDVKILRKQIELASVDYMEAQKKYLKVEKEFLDIKLLLHQRLEKKEMLTEHLCAIIEKNEERKATKLTELLNKLQLEDSNITEQSKENCSQSINKN